MHLPSDVIQSPSSPFVGLCPHPILWISLSSSLFCVPLSDHHHPLHGLPKLFFRPENFVYRVELLTKVTESPGCKFNVLVVDVKVEESVSWPKLLRVDVSLVLLREVHSILSIVELPGVVNHEVAATSPPPLASETAHPWHAAGSRRPPTLAGSASSEQRRSAPHSSGTLLFV